MGAWSAGSTLKFWSRTQALVALSSAKAELYGAVKATGETIGIISVLNGLGIDATGSVLIGASATLGMFKRKGLGQSRHVSTNFHWIQDAHENNVVDFSTVMASEHCSDMLTKYVPGDMLTYFAEQLQCEL